MKAKKEFLQLTSKNICDIYKRLYSRGIVFFPLASDSASKIDALVASINSGYFGVNLYESYEERAVAYLYFLIKNHPFVDGNKRTAVLSFFIVCDLNKLTLSTHKDFSIDELAVFLEKEQTNDYQGLIKRVAVLLFKD